MLARLYPISSDTDFRVIGQKELVKTAVVIEISMAAAVISFFKEDTGWTKRVGKNACNP